MRRDKPLTRARERFIEFTGNAVRVSKASVRAPLRAVSGNIHQGQSRGLRKSNVSGLRAVHLECKLQNRWRVTLFVNHDEQSRASPVLDLPVAHGIELSDTAQTSQQAVQSFCIERLANKRLQQVFYVFCGAGAGAFDADELRRQA